MSFSLRRPADAALDRSVMHFQRGSGVELRRRRRRVSLRLRHVVLLVFLQAAVFTGLQRLCLFLLDWDHLRLTRIEVSPSSEPGSARVAEEAFRHLSANLLALDTSRLAARIRSFPWVKDARIRKSYPSTLRLDLTFRRPMAVLDRGALYLVDADGVLLGTAGPAAADSLPLLKDGGNFSDDYPAKIGQARECLAGLSPAQRRRVKEIDLSRPEDLSLRLRDDDVLIVLGRRGSGDKLELYDRRAARWSAAFGRLAEVDLRIPDRAYLRLKAGGPGAAAAAAQGEVM